MSLSRFSFENIRRWLVWKFTAGLYSKKGGINPPKNTGTHPGGVFKWFFISCISIPKLWICVLWDSGMDGINYDKELFFEIVGCMESTMIQNLTKHSIAACTWNLFTEPEFHIDKDLFLASCFHLRCFFGFLRPVNSFLHVSHWNRTRKHWLSSLYAGLCGILDCTMHSAFFIRNPGKHAAYQFWSEQFACAVTKR